MNIPIEQIIALRENIEQGAKGINSLVNLLIIMEEDELTEQCGVNTSSTFNTPPKEAPPAPGKTQTPDLQVVLNDPEIWKCKDLYGLDGSRTDDFADPTAELSPAEFADLADQLEEDEEPREPNPVEVLIDAVLRVQAVGLVDMAREAQAFLDADTSLRELAQYAIEDAARELEGKTAVKTVLWQLDKRLQEVLNLHGEENKTD
tara:strand:- start:906 stop:1517 length:612 start_codon:yes stop_codon:yes gene_type:complete